MVLGGTGLVGSRTVRLASERHEVYATWRNTPPPEDLKESATWIRVDVDLEENVKRIMEDVRPEAIIDAHAYNKVDDCEDVGREECWRSNAVAPKLWAREANKRGIKYLYFSTDFVFDGMNPPYREGDTPFPQSFYAISKLVGEQSTLAANGIVFRTAVIYSWSPRTKFLSWLLNKFERGEKVTAFVDQWNNPTLAEDLAIASLKAVEKVEGPKLYHAVGDQCLSRYQMARIVAKTFGYDESLVEPFCSSLIKQKAKRPYKACLINEKIKRELGVRMRGFEEGIEFVANERKRNPNPRW